ncbi:MAG: T9SS type A sorting domain-containing protein [Bacteroidota bacterium]
MRGAGIWKSEDGGETWEQMSLENGYADTPQQFQYVNDILIRPRNGRSEIWVASGKKYQLGSWSEPAPGLYRSLDEGRSFESVLPTYEQTDIEPADIELSADNKLLVGSTQNSWGQGGGLILRSESGDLGQWEVSDFGGSFSFGRVEIACAPHNDSVMYAIGANHFPFNNNDILWFKQSRDGGLSWRNIRIPVLPEDEFTHFTRRQAWYNLILQVSPDDPSGNTLLAGGINLHMSQDGGSSWRPLTHWQGQYGLSQVHADQHQIQFRPGHPGELILGNDGGVYYNPNYLLSQDNRFQQRNHGYNVTQFYSGTQQNTQDSHYLLGGTQDNGSQRFNQPGINHTEEVSAGDGGICHIDEEDAQIQITSYIFSNFFISRDWGNSFQALHYGNAGSFINPSDYDSRNKSFYFAWNSQRYAYIADLRNEPTETHTAYFGQGRISHIKVSPHDSNTIYIGTTDGKVFKIENPQSPFPRSTRIDNLGTQVIESIGSVSCIALGQNPNHLIVTYYNYGVTSVWETKDAGRHWYNKEGNLPDMPIRWALIHPALPQKVLLATEMGVYACQDITASYPDWQPDNQGLATTRCDMLDYRKADGQLLVATHGRGIFTSASWKEPIAWTGKFSSQWQDHRNWIPTLIPQSNQSVVILASQGGNPLIIDTPTQVNNILIAPEAEVIIEDKLIVHQKFTSQGKVTMRGRTLQYLPNGIYQDLTIDNAAGVRLSSSVEVKGWLQVSRGNLDLRGYEIDLGNRGFLEENPPYAVTGKKGVIKANRYLSRPQQVNIAGLGIMLSSDKVLGITQVERRQLEGLPFQSIRQVFGIHPSNNQHLNAELRIAYKNQELNNLPAEQLQLFRSPDQGLRWYLKGGRVDPEKKEIYLAGIDQFSEWTAGFDIALSTSQIRLRGQRENRQEVQLSWGLPLRSSIPEFEIQKSKDATLFETIAYLKDIDETLKDQSEFKYHDISAFGAAYYRLKYNSSTDHQHISNVIYVPQELESRPQIYPVPFQNQLFVEWPGRMTELISIELMDQKGQVIIFQSTKNNLDKTIQIKALETLAPGAYFLRLRTSRTKVIRKVLKSP